MNTFLKLDIGAKSYPQNILMIRRRAFQNLDLWTLIGFFLSPSENWNWTLGNQCWASNPNLLNHKIKLRAEINGINLSNIAMYKILIEKVHNSCSRFSKGLLIEIFQYLFRWLYLLVLFISSQHWQLQVHHSWYLMQPKCLPARDVSK